MQVLRNGSEDENQVVFGRLDADSLSRVHHRELFTSEEDVEEEPPSHCPLYGSIVPVIPWMIGSTSFRSPVIVLHKGMLGMLIPKASATKKLVSFAKCFPLIDIVSTTWFLMSTTGDLQGNTTTQGDCSDCVLGSRSKLFATERVVIIVTCCSQWVRDVRMHKFPKVHCRTIQRTRV